MPIRILLIESDHEHAQAVSQALCDPWLVWHVEVAASIKQAVALLADQAFDVVIAAQRLVDGTAFDALSMLGGIPALIAVAPGQEAYAAHAMRHGFSDFLVKASGGDYLLTLPAQIDAVLERSSSARARVAAEELLARQHRLLQAITQAQAMFIANASPRQAFESLIVDLKVLTQSPFGVMGQVQATATGAPVLRIHAISDSAWSDEVQARFVLHLDEGMVLDSPPSFLGASLRSDQPTLLKGLSREAAWDGLPAGCPAVRDWMGLPIHAAGELVALVGLANRPGGYTPADVEFLAPLLATVGQLEVARREVAARSAADAQLAHTSALLADKTRALEGTLASVAQGISNVDADGRIRVFNERYLELLDLPRDLLETEPMVEDVVRFQAERGDFGADYELIEPQARRYVASETAAAERFVHIPEHYIRRTPAGRYIEVQTRHLPEGGRVRTFSDVTEYLETLNALRESEARWRSLTHLSSDWYWEQDAQFRFVRLDGSHDRKVEIGDEISYGHTLWELPHTYADEAQWQELRRQLHVHEVFHDFEMRHVTSAGESVWISFSGEPIFKNEGLFAGYRGVARNITERKGAQAQIQKLAFYDELTGLPNRRLLLDRLERAVVTSVREGEHGALLFMDLDNFKGVNDTMGHEWGDRLLVQVGERICSSLRDTDTVARLGGDEFVVILQGLDATESLAAAQVEAVAQKIMASLNQPFTIGKTETHSTSSIGITLFKGQDPPVPELLKRADLAMYQAKAQGRNTLCFFDPAMQLAATARSAMEGDIRLGLQRNEFLLHYQSVVNASGRILGAEVLVRWQHPQRGMVSPGDFIPVAEQTGLILPLGRQVLHQACRQLAQWAQRPETEHYTLSVNVSAQEFRHADFVAQAHGILQETGANPRRLKLELTESLLLHDVEDCIHKMQLLRTLGVGFSLDDFGTGYSSLSYLKRLPLDQLKIDQSFVRDVLTDPNDAVIACTIVALAQSLGLDVVAEGVENEGQLEFLLRNGCDRFQGYLFGRPEPLDSWMARHHGTSVSAP